MYSVDEMDTTVLAPMVSCTTNRGSSILPPSTPDLDGAALSLLDPAVSAPSPSVSQIAVLVVYTPAATPPARGTASLRAEGKRLFPETSTAWPQPQHSSRVQAAIPVPNLRRWQHVVCCRKNGFVASG